MEVKGNTLEADIKEAANLVSSEILRRVKDDPGTIPDHVLEKMFTSLARINEKITVEEVAPPPADVLELADRVPADYAKKLLLEEEKRLLKRLKVVETRLAEEF